MSIEEKSPIEILESLYAEAVALLVEINPNEKMSEREFNKRAEAVFAEYLDQFIMRYREDKGAAKADRLEAKLKALRRSA
ncbi:hypothetical protein AB0G00_23745 [Nocardia salmonicida]|uniref:hypothetical protein n=1 Tax=Nocardia salmonicida TaxID=53431 RepID=UPI0033FE1109